MIRNPEKQPGITPATHSTLLRRIVGLTAGGSPLTAEEEAGNTSLSGPNTTGLDPGVQVGTQASRQLVDNSIGLTVDLSATVYNEAAGLSPSSAPALASITINSLANTDGGAHETLDVSWTLRADRTGIRTPVGHFGEPRYATGQLMRVLGLDVSDTDAGPMTEPSAQGLLALTVPLVGTADGAIRRFSLTQIGNTY